MLFSFIPSLVSHPRCTERRRTVFLQIFTPKLVIFKKVRNMTKIEQVEDLDQINVQLLQILIEKQKQLAEAAKEEKALDEELEKMRKVKEAALKKVQKLEDELAQSEQEERSKDQAGKLDGVVGEDLDGAATSLESVAKIKDEVDGSEILDVKKEVEGAATTEKAKGVLESVAKMLEESKAKKAARQAFYDGLKKEKKDD